MEDEQEVPKNQETGEIEVNAELEEDNSLPFPNARVVRIMRNTIGREKQIRSEVKKEVNIWLGNVLKKISKEMSNTQYGSVGIADFKRAAKPYDQIDEILKDEARLLTSLEKIRLDSDYVIREMQRFFENLKE